MTKIISVMNYKGGVGKTTLTSNIGAELSYRGSRVLLIDLDPQSSLTFSFITPDDWKKSLSQSRTIKNWFDLDMQREVEFRKLIFAPQKTSIYLKEHGGGILHMIASHLDLINVDMDLATEVNGSTRKHRRKNFFKVYASLLRGIASLNDLYDYVIIDCPPNFNIITKSAIIASQYVLVPARPDYLSTLGITYLRRNLRDLVDEYNHFCDEPADGDDDYSKIHPVILGVVFTMVQMYDGMPISVQRQYIKEVMDNKVPVFQSYMRDNKTIFADAPLYLLPVVLDKQKTRRDIIAELERIVTELKGKTNEK